MKCLRQNTQSRKILLASLSKSWWSICSQFICRFCCQRIILFLSVLCQFHILSCLQSGNKVVQTDKTFFEIIYCKTIIIFMFYCSIEMFLSNGFNTRKARYVVRLRSSKFKYIILHHWLFVKLIWIILNSHTVK